MEVVGLGLLGLVAGALAATLGIGGGVVFVPVLVSVFMFSQHDAQGTSLAVIVPTVLVAAITHARAGRVLFRLTAWVGIAGILGAVSGAQLALHLDDALLRRFFAAVLIFVAIRMARRARNLFRASRTVEQG